MLIPRHCSNPKCHAPYLRKDGTDIYREVLVRLSTEQSIRVISVCQECRKNYNKQMAQDILKDVLPVEINQTMESATLSSSEKLRIMGKLSKYKIIAIGRDIDELSNNV